MNKNAVLAVIGFLIVLFFAGNAARFYKLDLINQLSVILYDYRLKLTMPGTLDERVVILDIDEKSLKQEGRWPWGRDRLGLLLDKLFDKYGIAVVGFDIVFAEKDESSGLKLLQNIGDNQLKGNAQFHKTLTSLKPQLDYDSQFAEKIRNRKVVLGYYLNNNTHKSGSLPEPTFPAGMFSERPIAFTRWDGYGANLPELQQAAASAGHFNPMMDFDGEVRRVPMLAEFEGAYYETLSLAVVRTLLGQSWLRPGFADDQTGNYAGLEWLELDTPKVSLRIPVDSDVATYVPYRGRQGSFRYISVTDVLHDRVDPALLKDKIVLVGTTAPGLRDFWAAPVAESFPGVEVHANLIAGILEQNLKERPAYMLAAEAMWLLLLGTILSLMLPRLGPTQAILVSGSCFLLTHATSLAAWKYGNTFMPVANSSVMIALLFALDMSYGYFFESRTKRQITGLFGQYVPAELVEEMSRRPESVSMEGQSREMTVLFSDVRGFTRISETLEPKELAMLMNEFLTPLSHIVHKHRGTIDKYMGDSLMAFWGAPLPDMLHARNAVQAALEMQPVLEALRPRFEARDWPEIRIGVGINTGRVSVGNMGSEIRVAYTVMGDAVNLASRLEGLTRQYGVGIIIGEDTRREVTDFVYRELDRVRVKGKDKPVAIYQPLGLIGQVDAAVLKEVDLFHEMLNLYRRQLWDQAERKLLAGQRQTQEAGLYEIYAERIAYFREHPPAAEWDGVFVFQTK